MFTAISWTSNGSKYKAPLPYISGRQVLSLAMRGQLCAMASSPGRPKPSLREGNTYISALVYSHFNSASFTNPGVTISVLFGLALSHLNMSFLNWSFILPGKTSWSFGWVFFTSSNAFISLSRFLCGNGAPTCRINGFITPFTAIGLAFIGGSVAS